MRRALAVLAALAAIALGFPVISAAAHADELSVANPSLEVDADDDGRPDCWRVDGYGRNTYSAARTTDAHTGTWAETIKISSYSSGVRRFMIDMRDPECAFGVQPGHVLELSAWYQLSGTARMTVWYRGAAGKWRWLSATALTPSTSWATVTYRTPALPADATVLSFGVVLVSPGTLSVDDFAAADATSDPGSGDLSLRVAANHLVDRAGVPVRLLGANRSGTQYACAEGWGIFDGPVDDAAISAMKSWGMTAVRVSLNEHCWLGINGVKPEYGGANYQAAIAAFVSRINAHGMYVILDLHWNAPGTSLALDQQAMPDRDHAAAFWSSVAGYFRDNRAVVFDLYNEPHPDSNRNTTAAWTCVRDGGSCPGVAFEAAGMQELVDAVRAAGAPNPIMVGGPQYAGAVDRWLEFAPTDPLNQLVASIHIYGPDYAPCWQQSCWDTEIAPLAGRVPVVIGEMGNIDCTHSLIDPLMTWADAHGVSYLAWAWFVGSCSAEPSLITDWSGTPTPYGVGLRDHLRSLDSGSGEPDAKTVVSLTFDDGSASQHSTLSMLKAHGMVGTYYINSAMVGSSGYYMTWPQIEDLAAAGNEIGGHTLHHTNLTKVDPATARAEVCDDRSNLIDHGFVVTSFAYPEAAVNGTAEQIVKECGYHSGRGVGNLYGPECPCPYAETIPPRNAYRLRTPDGVTTNTTLQDLKDSVTNAEKSGGGWVPLVFHGICDNRCTSSNSLSTSIFTAFLDWLESRRSNGTVVRTVAQVVQGSSG